MSDARFYITKEVKILCEGECAKRARDKQERFAAHGRSDSVRASLPITHHTYSHVRGVEIIFQCKTCDHQRVYGMCSDGRLSEKVA